MDFKESETLKILTRAFSAECQDGAFYQFMADEATQQKLSNVATILKQLATNEMAHAKIFYDYISSKKEDGFDMVEIKATFPMKSGNLIEMLKSKQENEERQSNSVYPKFAKIAEKEGYNDLANKFLQIGKIELCHSDVLSQLYEMIINKTIYNKEVDTLWKCLNCGHEDLLKKSWKKCPLCDKDQGYVKINLCGSSENFKRR